jgi:tetratricopeptide (TPR) repeat protein
MLYDMPIKEGMVYLLNMRLNRHIILMPAVVSIFLLIAGCKSNSAKMDENAYMKIAKEAIEKGNFDEAVVNLEKAILLNPKETRAYLKLGLIYEKIRLDPQKAKKYYLEFLKNETDEIQKREVEEWLKALEGIESPALEDGASATQGLVRLALEESEAGHRLEIEEIEKHYQREIISLKENLETAEKALKKEGIDVPFDSSKEDGLSGTSPDEPGESVSSGDSGEEPLKEEIKNLKAELAVARENDSSHIEKLAFAEKAFEDEKVKYATLENRFFELEKNYRTALARVNELTGQKVTDDKLPTAEKELADARAKISDLQQQLIKAKNDSAVFSEEAEKLKAENQLLKSDKSKAKTSTQPDKNVAVTTSKTRTDVTGVKEITGNTIHYSVQQGDTLSRIAEKFYSDRKKWTYIWNANRDLLKNQNDIKIGDTIKVPILK